ncbi:hypothetical protein EBN03_22295 [Nocardia stercoris]|uniref:Uncharacterized protein n=1 Tax=Nocardia stercoris TaxID=2483361 RepID=A0A3M2L3D3_9NOCA|nr:hypothetical protein EBN03_22295 [Nocardia stercoris]
MRDRVSIWVWIARAIAIALFVPPRLVWEGIKRIPRAIAAVVRVFDRYLLEPTVVLFRDWVYRPIRNFVRNYLWHWLIQHLLWGIVLTPLGALIVAIVLRPLQRVIEDWLWRRVVVPGSVWVFRRVLKPAADGAVRLAVNVGRWLIVEPSVALWRYVVRPVAHWSVWLAVNAVKWLVVAPIVGMWQYVLRPLAIGLRDAVLRPAGGWVRTRILPGLASVARAVGGAVRAAAEFAVTWLVVEPVHALWRWVLRPLIRAVVAAVRFGWRVATVVVGALVIAPCRWVHRTLLRPLAVGCGRVWRAVAGRVRWTYRTVIMPWQQRAREAWQLVFG